MEIMMAPTDAPAIHCNIEVVHQNGSVALRVRVVSASATSGDYTLEVQSRGPSGSSDVSQAGAFSGKPEVPIFVGLAGLIMTSGTRSVARLTVQTADARSCSAERVISEE
ncbi:MAG: hypothetical protein EKK29_20145 [Hyphomicrobiales bacterium]|nr:MAG: hypothetical protein EKK29_20145 [Hyphomicrobiales bacterium]